VIAVGLRGVSVRLGGRDVLADVGVAIEAGSFVGVIGPNGAGKTTLFRTMLGLIAPAAGTVEVLGRPCVHGNSAIGYVPQTRTDLGAFRLRARDFVASALDGHRWGLPLAGRDGARAVDRALDAVDALGLADRAVAELSGGERQRVLLAEALLGQPKLLLLDEPLMSLDLHRQSAIVSLVRSLQRDLRLTVLFSAHDLNPLLPAIDQVLYLAGGRAALGTVDEIVTGPSLSRLYGAPVDVVRVGGRIAVLAGSDVRV
jgi:zinc/manganese transport system ATP-binding protein